MADTLGAVPVPSDDAHLLDDDFLNLDYLLNDGGAGPDGAGNPFSAADLGALNVDFSGFDLVLGDDDAVLGSPPPCGSVPVPLKAELINPFAADGDVGNPTADVDAAVKAAVAPAVLPLQVATPKTVAPDTRNTLPVVVPASGFTLGAGPARGKGRKRAAPARARTAASTPRRPRAARRTTSSSDAASTDSGASGATGASPTDVKAVKAEKDAELARLVAKGLDRKAMAEMDEATLRRYLKKEERKAKNRIAAEKSRKKRRQIEQQEAAELAHLRVLSKEQQSEIAALRAENKTLKAQLQFFQLWVTRAPVPAPGAGDASPTPSTTSVQSGSSTDLSVDSDSRRGCGASVASANSASPIVEPSSPVSDVSMDSVHERVRFRARKRHGDTVHGGSDGDSVGSRSESSNSGLRAAAMAGAAFAIVFAFVLSANLDGMVSDDNLGLSRLTQQTNGGLSSLFSAAPATPAAGDVGTYATEVRGSGRVLHSAGASGVGHLAAHGHTMQASLGWAHSGGAGSADPAAAAAAFMSTEAPPVPHLWSPSAAVTFVLYALGIKRFAEVVLANALLLGVGVGMWSIVQKIRGGSSREGGLAVRRTRAMVKAEADEAATDEEMQGGLVTPTGVHLPVGAPCRSIMSALRAPEVAAAARGLPHHACPRPLKRSRRQVRA